MKIPHRLDMNILKFLHMNAYFLCRITKKDDGQNQIDETIIHDVSSQDQTTEYKYFNNKEPRIDKEGDQRMDRLGTKNYVPTLYEGVSKSFTQDDDAEFWRDLSPIIKKFLDEGFGGRLWTESEAKQMGDPQNFLQDWEMFV